MGGYKLDKLYDKITTLMYIDGIKMFAMKEKP